MVGAAFAVGDDGSMRGQAAAEPDGVQANPLATRPRQGIVLEEPAQPGTASAVRALSGMVAAVLVAVITLLPAPYSIQEPGPTFDVLDDASGSTLLSIEGEETYAASGQLRITTVAVQDGASHHLTFGQVLEAWMSPDSVVYPLFPDEGSYDGSQDWISSQEYATVAALGHLGIDVPTTLRIADLDEASLARGILEVDDVIVGANGTDIASFGDLDGLMATIHPGDDVDLTVSRGGDDVPLSVPTIDNGEGRAVMGIWIDPEFDFPFSVEVAIDNVGGPSGGMMFALAIIDLLTAADELDGHAVAGTGTIDLDGNVGPIGGIRLKMLGASEASVEWFIAPVDNCDEVVGHIPAGLNVIAVATIEDAYTAMVAIGDGSADRLPGCS